MKRLPRTDGEPQRCLHMVEVADVPCERMKQLRGYYCTDCPMVEDK